MNLLPLVEGERITAVLPIREFTEDRFVFMATRQGIVKKTPLTEYSRPRPSGIIAVDLPVDDDLVDVALTDGKQHVMLFRNDGKVIRFAEEDVRAMGRVARGVRGIRLDPEHQQRVIALIIVASDNTILTATENGFGKRTPVADYPLQGRGGQGVISIQTTERNGEVIGAVAVSEDDEVMLISQGGTLVRTPASGISVMGRNTQGVRLIQLEDGERLIGLERIVDTGGEDEADAEDSGGDGA